MSDAALTQPDPVVAEEHELHRSLGPVHLTMIGIGCIIGAGIFVITGTVAAQHAGPSVLLSFVIAALGCLFSGLCYAEFAALIPASGSAYTYAYATMGRFIGWFIGWNLILEYLFSASAVAVGWSGYFGDFLTRFGLHLPAAFMNAPVAGTGPADLHMTGALINMPAVILIVLMTTLLVVGIRESANFNAAMVVVKTAIVVLVIAAGLPFAMPSHLEPFIPPNQGHFGQFGISGMMMGAGLIFFSYIGFDSVSVAAQEAKNPQRDLPIGILASLGICTVLYMLMAFVLIGISDWRELDVSNPVSFAVSKIASLGWLILPINLGAIIGLASVVFVSLYGQSRIFYAMARDGFLPKAFAAVHPGFRTPHIGTIVTGAVAAILAAVFPLDVLADLVSIGTLLAFVVVCIGIMMLRVQKPDVKRPFRTPFVWFTAPAGILFCGAMAYSLSEATWIRLVIWTAIGVVIFFAYGIRHAQKSKWTVN
ncbi:MAG TPA: amino acid permease [Rhizomicrobium sp.]|jgi:APA family basic amino acid/polyamine antiporter|nr:amino acid permease [Rhizomicrobium sp.]